MSISDLVAKNSYELYNNRVGFSANTFGGSANSIPNGIGGSGTFLTGYGIVSADSNNYGSASFVPSTGILTIPISGFWHLAAGIYYPNFISGSPPATADLSYLVAIAPPGNTSDGIAISQSFFNISSGTNWYLNCEFNGFLPAGSTWQVFTQQNSGVTQSAPASIGTFFEGFLICNSPVSPV